MKKILVICFVLFLLLCGFVCPEVDTNIRGDEVITKGIYKWK